MTHARRYLALVSIRIFLSVYHISKYIAYYSTRMHATNINHAPSLALHIITRANKLFVNFNKYLCTL